MNYCDTPDWHLAGFIKWVAIGYPKQQKCSCRCFGNYGDYDNCRECGGTGVIEVRSPPTDHPKTPTGLEAHMQKAWKEFFEQGLQPEPIPWPYNTPTEPMRIPARSVK